MNDIAELRRAYQETKLPLNPYDYVCIMYSMYVV